MDPVISTDVANNLMALAVVKKLFGSTADEMAEDIKKIYIAGRDAVFNACARKVSNLDDGARTNFRITRDILWDGAFSSEAICAEYFGGILAASRSLDGKDDSALPYLNIIKTLSSAQLHLHYIIYNSFQNLLLVDQKEPPNLAIDSVLSKYEIYHSSVELQEHLGINLDIDHCILHKEGLIAGYKVSSETVTTNVGSEGIILFASAIPTKLGVQLYMVAHNSLSKWRQFKSLRLADFDGVVLPKTQTLDLQSWIKASRARSNRTKP